MPFQANRLYCGMTAALGFGQSAVRPMARGKFMPFVQMLKSLDELLYELMSWFVFFPITLWRLLRHPLAMMRYAEDQLTLEPGNQYRGTLSPPVMLILTIAVIECLDLAVQDANPIVASRHGLAGLVNDDTSLLFLRLALFGAFALVLATRKVHRSDVGLDRDTLKAPYYAQCYAVAPFALLLSSGVTAAAQPDSSVKLAGGIAIVAALLFYAIVEVRWFHRELNQSILRSLVDASIGIVASFAITIGLGLLFR